MARDDATLRPGDPPEVTALAALVLTILVSCTGVPPAPPEPPQEATPEGVAASPQEPGTDGQEGAVWSPAIPARDGSDWIRLVSGEWLRGEIDSLSHETVEFDSDELDELVIDWEDVIEVRTTRLFSVRRVDLTTTLGSLEVRDGGVVVRGDEGEVRYPRAELHRAVPGGDRELNYWSGHLTLAGSFRSGNTDQTDTSASISVLRRTAASRFSVAAESVFGKLEGEESVDNQRLTISYDRFVTPRFYVTPIAAELYRDPFQNIDYRATPYGGVGYALVDRSGFDWDVLGGVGYRFTKFDSVEAGEDDSEGALAAVIGTQIDADLTKKIEWFTTHKAFISLDDSTMDHDLTTGVSIDVIGDLDFDVKVNWRRTGDPEADADGDTPDKDDFRIDIGIGWEF